MPYSDPDKQRAADAKAKRLKKARIRALREAGVAAVVTQAIAPLRTAGDLLTVLEEVLAAVRQADVMAADPASAARQTVAIVQAANQVLRDGDIAELRAVVEELEKRLAA